MDLLQAFNALKKQKQEYFEPYCFNHPLVFTEATYRDMKTIGHILYKAINFYLENPNKYRHLFPRNERDEQIMAICNNYPCSAGTFRTDFVIDTNGCLKLIEITSRQPLNGYFSSGIFREIALKQAKRLNISSIVDVYPELFDYMESIIGHHRRITVIKGNNKLEEFHFYSELFKQAGIDYTVIPIDQLHEKTALLNNSWIIEELTFDEIRQLPDHLIGILAEYQIHNNIKTLFTTHDKTFFHLLSHPDFQDDIMAPNEQQLLNKHLVPTYVYGANQTKWDDAYENREGYILKHREKGKSVDIFAGKLCSKAEWQQLFDSGAIKNMILQPFIEQRMIHGFVGEEQRHDYAVGTLLYYNDRFFGPGLYRTSSHPVSNIKNHRKAAMLISSSTKNMKQEYCL